MKTVFSSVLFSVLTSVIVARVVVGRYFKIMDRYAKDLIDLAKREIEEAYSNRDKR